MPTALLDDAARPRPRAGCLLALGAACAALAYVGAGARDGGATLSLAVGAAAGAERFALPDPATVVVEPLDDRFALAGGEEYFSMTGRLLDRQVATETHAVFDEVLTEAEAWEALSVADFRAHCANVTFGYCGRSTCHIDGAKESSTCGCKKIVNGAGSIGFNSRNAYLIRSALVRRALYEITVLNETSYFVNTVCGAIKNKRFWHEAGFDSDFGSMSVPLRLGPGGFAGRRRGARSGVRARLALGRPGVMELLCSLKKLVVLLQGRRGHGRQF